MSIESANGPALTVGSVPVEHVVDPTGGGDAFRAGFLWGLDQHFGLERAAQVGCATAALALETVGPQDFTLDRQAFVSRIGQVYGEQAEADVRRCLACATTSSS